MSREAALEAAYRAMEPRISGIGASAFAKAFDGWEVLPVKNPPVGAVFIKGNEIHVAIVPEHCGRWFGRWSFGVLNGLKEKYGSVVTKVAKGNAEGEKFVRRIGFVNKGDFWELT